MADPRTARIRLGDPGLATIEIDGQDVSDAIRGFTLTGAVDERHQLTLDLLLDTAGVEGEVQARIPAATAGLLVALGWTPPDDGQPVDLTARERHDAVIKIIKREARRDPQWFRTLLRREHRVQGGRTGWLQSYGPERSGPPRMVKVDGVLTEGDADIAREALRQMDADPHGLQAGMIVKPYTERGQRKWVFRCWGTDDGCDGYLSLDHTSQASAESARDRHAGEEHRLADGEPR